MKEAKTAESVNFSVLKQKQDWNEYYQTFK